MVFITVVEEARLIVDNVQHIYKFRKCDKKIIRTLKVDLLLVRRLIDGYIVKIFANFRQYFHSSIDRGVTWSQISS